MSDVIGEAVTATEDAPPTSFVTPDFMASREPSVIERVKAKARGGGDKATQDTPKATKPPKATVPRANKTSLTQSLQQMYAFAGMGLMPFDPVCGTAVMMSAESCAESLAELAQHNESVRRVLLALTQTGAWGGVLAAHLPLVLAIVSHHGPEGAIPPAVMQMLTGEIPKPSADEADAA